jgi:hypothetical protein
MAQSDAGKQTQGTSLPFPVALDTSLFAQGIPLYQTLMQMVEGHIPVRVCHRRAWTVGLVVLSCLLTACTPLWDVAQPMPISMGKPDSEGRAPFVTTIGDLIENAPSRKQQLQQQTTVERGIASYNRQDDAEALRLFRLDTGATDVHIPLEVVLTLLRTGTIKHPDDFLPGATYILADGTPVQSRRFTLRSLVSRLATA